MKQTHHELSLLLSNLKERAKELNCLYEVETILQDRIMDEKAIFGRICDAIPAGWQFPEICRARISFGDVVVTSPSFVKTKWTQKTSIIVDNVVEGTLEIFYLKEQIGVNGEVFLPEELKLLNAIAERIGRFVAFARLKETIGVLEQAKDKDHSPASKDWKVVLELLQSTDLSLYLSISRKMMNYLCWIGIQEAKDLLGRFSEEEEQGLGGQHSNSPIVKQEITSIITVSQLTFQIAERSLSASEITNRIKMWIKEDKISYLVSTLEDYGSSLTDIQNAITRYYFQEKLELPEYITTNINVLAIYRLLTDQLEFINIAKNFVEVTDFYELIKNVVYPDNGRGKLGGKSSGIFLAQSIIRKSQELKELADWVKIPRSWYVTSDVMQRFLQYNNLMEVFDQKYKSIEQVREEYPNIVQIFKNSHFPPEIVKGLSLVIEAVGTKPIIVRSSSLLEDRVGAAFSGKYKSLFLANQGTKRERLNALKDAIAEIYASTFNADPIEYRKERGFLDFREEMAIIIMEVVGTRIGDYFMPAFAGVAFSDNHQRWSPRIRRTDGLVRLVPGLGTRAVDRVSDDYPVLIAPGQPDLRVNISLEEIVHYAPAKIDLINMRTNSFETHDIQEVLRECGENYPGVSNLISVRDGDTIKTKALINTDFVNDEIILTFDKLFKQTDFLPKIKSLLELLREKMGTAVDIEFAHDGEDFYLLQCRSQNNSGDNSPAPIPQDIQQSSIVFSASKYVTNGLLTNISHVVYVSPEGYSDMTTVEDLKTIGRIVSSLNKILPKKRFILMGPGRWGSRGDIKLGVSVGYSDINNTSLLIEIARKKGNYTPDLSFGTHFFQDLVEAEIKYLPLYPDEEGNILNDVFLTRSENILPRLLPEFSRFKDVVKVVDIKAQTVDKTLTIAMNGELNKALAYLSSKPATLSSSSMVFHEDDQSTNHWKWRMNAAEQIGRSLPYDAFGVEQCYVFGSTSNGSAGASSDIDLLIHFRGTDAQRINLDHWFEGWSKSLAYFNYLKTGYKNDNLLDCHFVTDDDIRDKSVWAVKIDAVTDAARPLPKSEETS
ncbi:nucleotidyltransferase domain-containing protein [Myxococcota bacterium]|nr:nucleotidyltransferase domain-containing protein [Myxococcota bacterium]MBU1535042.1 nucleotidyltransferase domain-containing protein [Myxococcota bacterium]